MLSDDNNPIIITNKGELQLMFARLAIDVLEHPEWYESLEGTAIEDFYNGENHRRNLENRSSKHLK